MAGIKFDLAPVADTEFVNQKRPNIGMLVENIPLNQLPDDLRFSNMGGIPPMFRSGIIRIALGKLAATGVLAALVSIRTTDNDAAFSCALAAAVNFVACGHYYLILKVRAQELSFLSFGSGHNVSGEWKGRSEQTYDGAKMFLQEFICDGLRHSDWTVRASLHVLPFSLAFALAFLLPRSPEASC